jgi:uncharacterized repeat protein (TIGR02543 family)
LLAAACPEQPGGGETKYTVTFDTNGGNPETIAPVLVTGGSAMSEKFTANTKKTGYNFNGWYDESVSPAARYTKNTAVTKDVTLKARWTIVYTVSFYIDDESEAPASIKIAGGSSIGNQFPEDPEKADLTFNGWYDNTVTPAEKYSRDTVITKNVTLKADWLTRRDLLLKEIEETWEELGYTVMPTKYVAISFDDGPCPASSSGGTAAMLTALETLKVKATFFVIGSNVRSNNAAAKAIFEAGHEMGNHSDGYNSLGGTTAVNTITASLTANSTAIKAITGKDPVLFRAPNLAHGNNLSQVCKDMGMALIDGSTNDDWASSNNFNSEAIKNSVLNNPKDGDIILLHENNTSEGKTMAVLPDIVNGLRERGFWITTVSQLAIIKEKTLEPGTRYSSIN